MSPTPLRFAIIGCGRMGRHHGRYLAADSRAEIAAVFDPVRSAAELLVKELAPKAVVCGSLEEIWKRSDINAVVLCTPTRDHFGQAKTALGRGWHVLCEKPLAATAEQIQDLVAIGNGAMARGQRFAVGYQRRHWATFRTLKSEVQSGRWGAVRSVNVHGVEAWQAGIPGTWRDDPEQNPGGYLGDAGSHKLDILFYVTGLPAREVFARSWKRGSHVEIVTTATAVFGEDVPVTIDFIGDAHHLGEDWHFHCEKADLILRHHELLIARDNRIEPLEKTAPHSEPAQSFLETICSGAMELAPPECAWPVYQLTQAILQSSATGRIVTV